MATDRAQTPWLRHGGGVGWRGGRQIQSVAPQTGLLRGQTAPLFPAGEKAAGTHES